MAAALLGGHVLVRAAVKNIILAQFNEQRAKTANAAPSHANSRRRPQRFWCGTRGTETMWRMKILT